MEFIKEWGMIAGLSGIALSVFVILFREVIRKNIFSKLTKKQSFVIIVIFMGLVTIASMFSIIMHYKNTKQNGQVTVLVHGERGKDELVLPNRGIVKLLFGDAIIEEKINAKGEATFKQIPAYFFKEKAAVEILFSDPEGEPYRAKFTDSSYYLSPNTYIPLEVKLFGLDAIKGIVKNSVTSEAVDSVRISILGVDTYSNKHGEYQLIIPKELQKKYQTVRATKEGYQPFELNKIPVQTSAELPIFLEPKK